MVKVEADMCGLIFSWKNGKSYKRQNLDDVLDSINHRGVEGRRGSYTDSHVYMGHVRLPIRGLGKEYDQPIQKNEYVGLFVGELFDVDEINDAQYALYLLDERGPVSLSTYDGFWSIIHYNRLTHRTMVVTDHLGIKPLYWDYISGTISSELRGILNTEKQTISQHYLSNVRKWGYDPSGRTPYEGVVRMDPGTVYFFNQYGNLDSKRKYYHLSPSVSNISAIQYEIEQAVRNRLVSDVPVAALCSGGLDSTIVSMLAAKELESRGQDLTVFHIENKEQEYFDAIDWPDNVTVKHITLDEGSLEEALIATEEPVDLGSVLPQYQLGKAVHDAGFKVVLSGDGADELFGGYHRAQLYDSQYSDIFSELVHYHNPRLDKCMMSHTVELRSPFLAPAVICTALALPWHKRRAKEALKEAFKDIIPGVILARDKVALKTPQVAYGGQDYREDVIQGFLRRQA